MLEGLISGRSEAAFVNTGPNPPSNKSGLISPRLWYPGNTPFLRPETKQCQRLTVMLLFDAGYGAVSSGDCCVSAKRASALLFGHHSKPWGKCLRDAHCLREVEASRGRSRPPGRLMADEPTYSGLAQAQRVIKPRPKPYYTLNRTPKHDRSCMECSIVHLDRKKANRSRRIQTSSNRRRLILIPNFTVPSTQLASQVLHMLSCVEGPKVLVMPKEDSKGS